MEIARISRLHKIKFWLCVITLLMVISYDYMPEKTKVLFPLDSNITKGTDDRSAGGKSEFSWIDKKNSKWQCDFKFQKGMPDYCQFTLHWSTDPYQEIDFSRYTRLKIDMDYQGDGKVIRTILYNAYDPKSSLHADKPSHARKRASDFSQPTYYDLDLFNVLDWWLNDNQVVGADTKSDLTRINGLNITISRPYSYNTHSFHLKQLQLVGPYFSKELLYLSIISFWSILLLSEIIINYVKLKQKLAQDAKKLLYSQEQSARYKQKSETDTLTGIFNREGLAHSVKSLEDMRLLQQYALLVIDIDKFKNINDLHGHLVGDRVIQEIAEILSHDLRSYDILGRWGGEEFVILFYCLDHNKIQSFAEKIRQAVESHIFLNGTMENVRVSIGATKVAKKELFDGAFSRADKALYQAKETGRNKTVID